jgi:hypothetical protein
LNGLTVKPGIPLGVVGDIDSIFTSPVLQPGLKDVNKIGIHQFHVTQQVFVEDSVNQLQLINIESGKSLHGVHLILDHLTASVGKTDLVG